MTLRRVERQQQLIERLHASADRMTLQTFADHFSVSTRTIARDVDLLRQSGVPLDVATGRDGGVRLRGRPRPDPIGFDIPEIAALMASLSALGPTATDSAASAMRKLTAALRPEDGCGAVQSADASSAG